MELHHLRHVLAVVDHGTFTAAAAACHVAQPSLSQSVRGLERELGAELFHRAGRRVVLTAAGEAFVPAARDALWAAEEVRTQVAAVSDVVAGHLDLVALPTLAIDPVAPLVGAFRQAHPGVVVRLAHPDSTRELVERVRSGASELGVTELPVAEGRLVTVTMGRQELVAVLPPGGRAGRRAGAGSLALAALAREALVTLPVGTSTRDALDLAFARAGVQPRVAVETDQREAIVPLVLAGAGCAVVPRPMAMAASGEGVLVRSLRPPLWRDLGLVRRPGVPSPAAQAFLAIAADRA